MIFEREKEMLPVTLIAYPAPYLVPGPGLGAECRMVNSPDIVPVLRKFILVSRDADNPNPRLSAAAHVRDGYWYQLRHYKLMRWFVPIASPLLCPLLLFCFINSWEGTMNVSIFCNMHLPSWKATGESLD